MTLIADGEISQRSAFYCKTVPVKELQRGLEVKFHHRVVVPAEIKAQRDMLARILPEFRCVEKVYPSDANFLLVKVTRARELYEKLIADELIVRDRSTTKGCEGCLRITVGTPEENKKLIDIISDYDKP